MATQTRQATLEKTTQTVQVVLEKSAHTMQATLGKPATTGTTFEKTVLQSLLQSLETADNNKKSEIENNIITLGESIIPDLVSYLQIIKGTVRGVIAMVLIRMGDISVQHLNFAAKCNKDFEWVAQYLISEIGGTAKAAA